MAIGQRGIRRVLFRSHAGRNLIGQHLQRQPRILFGVIHMPNPQPIKAHLQHGPTPSAMDK
jgi:hypothetical protein